MSVMHSCHNVIGWCLFAPHESHGLLSAGSWLKLSFCTCCALVSMEIRGWLSWTPWVFLIDQLWLWIICFEPHYGVKEPLWEGLTNVRIKTTGPFSLSAVMTGEKIRICNQQNLIHSLQEKHYRCKHFRTWPEHKEVYALSWTEALHSSSVCPGNNCYADTVQRLRHSACYILPKHRGMWAGFKVELEFNGAATAINQ